MRQIPKPQYRKVLYDEKSISVEYSRSLSKPHGIARSSSGFKQIALSYLKAIIAVLTREHGGWEQTAGLITAVARSRVKYLVLARSAGTRCLTKSAPRFTAAKPP